jgi:excisionase family DNA binding protein
MTTGIAMAERYLTVDDIAERLQVSEWVVREWLKSGKLIGFQPAGRRGGWRIEESDLQAFVEESKRQTRQRAEEE